MIASRSLWSKSHPISSVPTSTFQKLASMLLGGHNLHCFPLCWHLIKHFQRKSSSRFALVFISSKVWPDPGKIWWLTFSQPLRRKCNCCQYRLHQPVIFHMQGTLDVQNCRVGEKTLRFFFGLHSLSSLDIQGASWTLWALKQSFK